MEMQYRVYEAYRNAAGGVESVGNGWDFVDGDNPEAAAREYSEQLGDGWRVIVATDDAGDSYHLYADPQPPLTLGDVMTATAEQLADELAAAGIQTDDWRQLDIDDLRRAVVEQITSRDEPDLTDYYTSAVVRPANADEVYESIEQATRDGGPGVITVDGRSCYVC